MPLVKVVQVIVLFKEAGVGDGHDDRSLGQGLIGVDTGLQGCLGLGPQTDDVHLEGLAELEGHDGLADPAVWNGELNQGNAVLKMENPLDFVA